jgi:hypothetical protein
MFKTILKTLAAIAALVGLGFLVRKYLNKDETVETETTESNDNTQV